MADKELHMDTEVRVCVKTRGTTIGTSPGHVPEITVLSTEHEITKIVLWQGKQTGSAKAKVRKFWEKSKNDYTETTENADGPPKDAAKPDGGLKPKKNCHKVEVSYDEGLLSEHFPILVDVYEKPTDGEEDAHRHGWFNKAGRLDPSKNHKMKKPWADYARGLPGTDDERMCWYGHWLAADNKINKTTHEMDTPPSYESDDS